MSKEQTPITVDEMAKQIRNFVQVMSFDQKGNSEFLEKRVAEYLEQYANAKVLETLEEVKDHIEKQKQPKLYPLSLWAKLSIMKDEATKQK
jgi:hypothetical protein